MRHAQSWIGDPAVADPAEQLGDSLENRELLENELLPGQTDPGNLKPTMSHSYRGLGRIAHNFMSLRSEPIGTHFDNITRLQPFGWVETRRHTMG